MLINGSYNLIDAYFVTHYVGEVAFSAVSTSFPLVMFIIALSVMISNGTSVLVSQYLGQNNNGENRNVVGTALILSVAVSFVVMAVCLVTQDNLLQLLGATVQNVDDAKTYLTPLLIFSVMPFLLSLVSDLLRSTNQMSGLLLVILVGAVGNIALDALLIIVLELGVVGAAYATVTSQTIAVLTATYLLKMKTPLRAKFSMALGAAQFYVKRILSIGLPLFIVYFGAVIVMATVNSTLTENNSREGVLDVAAYGIWSRMNVFIILPLIAMANAGQTIIAYNFGAGNAPRIKNTYILNVVIATLYLSIMTWLILSFPSSFISVFSNDERLIDRGLSIVFYLFIGIPIAGLGFISVAVFQALGQARLALFLSVLKVYLILLPLLFFIREYKQTEPIWYAFPTAEVLSFIVVVIVLTIKLPKLLSKIKSQPDSRLPL
jgi:putative MATE family efflux protein